MQEVGKPLDRHIREREERGKDNAELCGELLAILGLECALVGGQESAEGVVDEV